MQALSSFTEEFHQSASEFLDALSPRHESWSTDPERWVFRGHGDSRWLLVPNALRSGTRLNYGTTPVLGPLATFRDQATAELRLLTEFMTAADAAGHALPAVAAQLWSMSPQERTELLTGAGRSPTSPDGEWPQRHLMPLLALAQHYGVPTRLLDWTTDARIAAYFAASTAARLARQETARADDLRLSVWAAATGTVQVITRNTKLCARIEFRTVLRHGNENLMAQRGLFSVLLEDRQIYDPPTTTPLDELIVASQSADNRHDGQQLSSEPALRHLTLPLREAGALLRLLRQEGVTASSIFPSLSAVAD